MKRKIREYSGANKDEVTPHASTPRAIITTLGVYDTEQAERLRQKEQAPLKSPLNGAKTTINSVVTNHKKLNNTIRLHKYKRNSKGAAVANFKSTKCRCQGRTEFPKQLQQAVGMGGLEGLVVWGNLNFTLTSSRSPADKPSSSEASFHST